jgi:transposase
VTVGERTWRESAAGLKRVLTAEQKYDLWVRILTGQVTQADAAAEAGVDRTTIATLREVARDGAIAALLASRPGRGQVCPEEASELAKLRAEVDRLGAVVIDQAVELAVLRGKSSWG